MGHGRFLRRAHRRERRGQETEIEKIKIQDETRPCAAAPWPHSSGRHCGMRAGRRARVRPRVSTLRSTFKVSYFFLPVPEMEGRRTILLFNVHVPYILTQLAVETHRVSKAELQDTTTPSSELSPFRVGPWPCVRSARAFCTRLIDLWARVTAPKRARMEEQSARGLILKLDDATSSDLTRDTPSEF